MAASAAAENQEAKITTTIHSEILILILYQWRLYQQKC